MRVVSTFFHPSSVLHSLKCRLDESELEYLIVATPNKLEVLALLPEGAKVQCSLEIWGVISSLKAVHHVVSHLIPFYMQYGEYSTSG